MRRIDFIITEAAGNTEVFARDFCLCKLMGRKYCPLTAQQQLTGKVAVKQIVPSAAAARSSIFVYFRYI